MSLLKGEAVRKDFGGLRAVNDVDFVIEEGEIVGLVGPNGAGKTTLFNVISGFYAPTAGKVHFNGEEIQGLKPFEICRKGIARTFQVPRPLLKLSVFTNILAGCLFGRSEAAAPVENRAEVERIIHFLDLTEWRDTPAENLNVAQRKTLEIGRALATGPRLILLDEVVAGLNRMETDRLMEKVRQIRDSGVTLFFVEHVMRAIMSISDRIYVLNFGERIAEGTPEQIAGNPAVIEAYLGRGVHSA
jgi:branched-chain amino acid transport system ATP-binding protein